MNANDLISYTIFHIYLLLWIKVNLIMARRYDMPNQLNIEYPQNLPDILQTTKKAFEEEARMAMAVKLFSMCQ